MPAVRTVIFLIRHGDRFDYANKEVWQQRCEQLGIERADPPLSALGHTQARETAEFLKDKGIDRILCSPYLRVIQTAQPLAHATGVKLSVEDGLAEFGHTHGTIPPAPRRYAVFPEVDLEYVAMDREYAASAESGTKELSVDYLRRMIRMARELPKHHAGSTVACFSHAASVALVAALTGCTELQAAGKFAPCGIFKLVNDGTSDAWTLEATGEDNTGHVKTNAATTFPWGFAPTAEPNWVEARRLEGV
tara:strand:- start:196 stop:942 length:747 start_codon:yes stop_codon:yes gene_type:complete